MPDNLRNTLEALKLADMTQRAMLAQNRELDLDIAIADRSGDKEARRMATAKRNANSTEWHKEWLAAKELAKALCDELGLKPSELKALL